MAVKGPFNGVRVLDLTHVWAGPLAVRFLADLGAEVVRVEAPYGRGPRSFPSAPIGGWLPGGPDKEPWNHNAMFAKLTRNRASVCVDLKQAAGRSLLLELVAQADVLAENFSRRAMPALGLDDDTLFAANPRLIHLAMTGFGDSGPLADRVAFGPTVEAVSGLTQVMGYSPDEPRNTAMALMDPIAAAHAFAALSAALRRRAATGQGGRVSLSLYEGGVSVHGPWLLDVQAERPPAAMGNRHPAMAPHGIFPCRGADAWVAIACEDDRSWANLCDVLLQPDLRPGWPLAERIDRQVRIEAAICAWTVRHDKLEAAERLQAAGIAAGPVNAAPDLAQDAQALDRGFFAVYERSATPMPGNPVRLDGLDSAQWRPSPDLGADNMTVLNDWLGWDAERVGTLTSQGVLHTEPPG